MQEKSSRTIHQEVLRQIDSLLEHLDLEDKNLRVKEVIAEVQKTLEPRRKALRSHIAELEKHVNWDRFVIAFYGETNAGKSTIIETLRIILHERGKTEDRRKILPVLKYIEAQTETIKNIANNVEICKTQIEELCRQYDAMLARHEKEQQETEQDLVRLRDLLFRKKAALTFWGRLVSLFRPLPENTMLENGQYQFSLLKKSQEAEKNQLEEQISEKKKQHKAQADLYAIKESHIQNELESIEYLADGAIIGNGKSDSTRNSHEYIFEFGGQTVVLLDVPGIEGREQDVMSSISAAVKGAHAVFYVTRKPNAPQTGDAYTEGTLEKIRKHLGDQTEVWALYNKSATSPSKLLEAPLLGDDERNSLAVMDNTLREHLGENHYQGHFVISALPAFLAVADYVLESNLAKRRKKFLECADPGTWLDKSGFAHFSDWLGRSAAQNSQARILKANINKVTHGIQAAVEEIRRFQHEIAEPLALQINAEWVSTKKMLMTTADTLGAALHNESTNAIQYYIGRVRERMYKHIADDIENKAVQPLLQAAIDEEKNILQDAAQAAMEKQIKKLQENVKKILEQFKEHTKEIREMFRSSAQIGFGDTFDLKMDFDNGIDVPRLVSNIISLGFLAAGAANVWNPGGWVMLALGALGIIIGFYKSVRNFFSSDYKKSQQRKSVDENLRKISKSLESSMKKQCVEVVKAAKDTIATIIDGIQQSVENIDRVNHLLLQSSNSLALLSKKISS